MRDRDNLLRDSSSKAPHQEDASAMPSSACCDTRNSADQAYRVPPRPRLDPLMPLPTIGRGRREAPGEGPCKERCLTNPPCDRYSPPTLRSRNPKRGSPDGRVFGAVRGITDRNETRRQRLLRTTASAIGDPAWYLDARDACRILSFRKVSFDESSVARRVARKSSVRKSANPEKVSIRKGVHPKGDHPKK